MGIDVEQNKKANFNVARRCFTKAELQYVLSGKEKSQQRFFEVWTKKEAYVKLLGTGIQDFLKFNVVGNKTIDTIFYQNYTVSVARK